MNNITPNSPNINKKIDIASMILISICLIFILTEHLMVAGISGMLLYTISSKISNKINKHFNLGKYSKTISIAFIVLIISLFIGGIVLGFAHLLKTQNNSGISWLLITTADMLEKTRQSLPDNIATHIPNSIDEIKKTFVDFLKANGAVISSVGFNSLHQIAGFIIGIVAGAMLSFAQFKPISEYKPFSAALLTRFERLRYAFDQIVSAQVKISLLNTFLTFIYLGCILPLFGYHIPLTKTIILVTFITGLLPVIGNLISNTIIIVVSAGVSIHIGIASLVFLIVIHKLEYFLNANIIGKKVNASPWELILAMVAMEVVFGLPGLVAAPIIYSYIKIELTQYDLIGHKK